MHFLQIWVREVALRSASDALRWDGPCRLEGLCRCKVVAAALLAGPAIFPLHGCSSAPVSGDRRPTDRLFRTRHTKSKFVPVSRCQAVLSKSRWCSDHDLKHSKSGLLTSSHTTSAMATFQRQVSPSAGHRLYVGFHNRMHLWLARDIPASDRCSLQTPVGTEQR